MMNWSWLLLALILASCTTHNPDSSYTRVNPIDRELQSAIDQKYPLGFYHETHIGSPYYARASNGDEWYLTCSDDFNEASALAIRAETEGSVIRHTVSHQENERYFEFTQLDDLTSQEQYALLFRVEKCSYLNRSQSDMIFQSIRNTSSTLGFFNVRPITRENAREMVEYLWSTNIDQVSGFAVLNVTSEETNNEILVTLDSVYTVGGDWGMCDRITLGTETFSIDKVSGLIVYTHQNGKTLSGRCQ